MSGDFIDALSEIEKDRGISKDIIFDALESALISSYKKNFNSSQNVEVQINKDTGKVKVLSIKEVAAEWNQPRNDPFLGQLTILQVLAI